MLLESIVKCDIEDCIIHMPKSKFLEHNDQPLYWDHYFDIDDYTQCTKGKCYVLVAKDKFPDGPALCEKDAV
jgi:hypothetical protein